MGAICVDFQQALEQETRKAVVKKEEGGLVEQKVFREEPPFPKSEGLSGQLDLHSKPLFRY